MVEFAHAVTYPGTVVVHPKDALSADAAVVHPRLLDQVALGTIPDAVQRLDLLSAYRNPYKFTSPFFFSFLHNFFRSFSRLDRYLISSNSSL